jgi:hypothetical protein
MQVVNASAPLRARVAGSKGLGMGGPSPAFPGPAPLTRSGLGGPGLHPRAALAAASLRMLKGGQGRPATSWRIREPGLLDLGGAPRPCGPPPARPPRPADAVPRLASESSAGCLPSAPGAPLKADTLEACASVLPAVRACRLERHSATPRRPSPQSSCACARTSVCLWRRTIRQPVCGTVTGESFREDSLRLEVPLTVVGGVVQAHPSPERSASAHPARTREAGRQASSWACTRRAWNTGAGKRLCPFPDGA